MEAADVAAILRDALTVMLELGGPPLLAALAVGLLVSLLQAVTQINEATLVFVPKALALGVVMALLGGFMMTRLGDFTRLLFDRMIAVGGT
jgi:flagellar biosynthetic protein FliQ